MIECLKTRRGEREVCLAVFLRGFHDGIIVSGGVDFAGGSGGESGGRHDRRSDIHAYNECVNMGRNASMDMWALKKYPSHREWPNIVSFDGVYLASRIRGIHAT